MSAADIRQIHGDMLEPLYCQRCGEIIGVYEPLVVGDEHRTRVTSRAAEPALPVGGSYRHHSCLRSSEATADAA